MAYTLHTYKFWPDAMAARVALQEQGDQAELVDVDMSAGANKTPAFLKLNPAGEPPVLVDDKGPMDTGGPLTLWETMAISQYLNDKHVRQPGSKPVLFPNDPEVYPLSLQWATWTQINLVPAVEQVLLNSKILPSAQRNLVALFLGAAQTLRALTFLETQVPDQANGPAFMARGPQGGAGVFSFADITLGATLTYAHLANQQMPLQNFPKLSAYLQMLETRPSFRNVFTGVTI